MNPEFEAYGYHITTDHSFMDGKNAITPDLKSRMDDFFEIGVSGKKSGIKKLQDAIERYPKTPQLKNYLSVLYAKLGMAEKAKEVNLWILKEHPDYLFGKLNLAFDYFAKGEADKLPEILGANFELKELYPEREIFHLIEFLGMLKAAVYYYSSVGEIAQAEIRLNMLRELDPDSEETSAIENFFMGSILTGGLARFMEDSERKTRVKIKEQKATEKITAPKFNHPEIEILYKSDFYLAEEEIKKILELPRETLIQDLEKVLKDSIERYSFFEEDFNLDDSTVEFEFVVHAVFFLAELNATDSLELILEVLSQSEEYLDLFLSDFIPDVLWEPLYKLGNHNLEAFEQFMKKPGVYTYSKTEIAVTVEQIAHHQPERREEVLNWFEETLNFFMDKSFEDNVIDSDMIAFVIDSILNLKAENLLPLVERLYGRGIVSEMVCGSFDDFKKLFYSDSVGPEKKSKLMSLTERYHDITSTWIGYNDDFDDGFEEKFVDDIFAHLPKIEPKEEEVKTEATSINSEYLTTPPIIKPDKIGRNEPCTCGSGKKYKKCCMN